MKATYDARTDTLSIILRVDAAVAESDEDKPGVILDYDEGLCRTAGLGESRAAERKRLSPHRGRLRRRAVGGLTHRTFASRVPTRGWAMVRIHSFAMVSHPTVSNSIRRVSVTRLEASRTSSETRFPSWIAYSPLCRGGGLPAAGADRRGVCHRQRQPE